MSLLREEGGFHFAFSKAVDKIVWLGQPFGNGTMQ